MFNNICTNLKACLKNYNDLCAMLGQKARRQLVERLHVHTCNPV